MNKTDKIAFIRNQKSTINGMKELSFMLYTTSDGNVIRKNLKEISNIMENEMEVLQKESTEFKQGITHLHKDAFKNCIGVVGQQGHMFNQFSDAPDEKLNHNHTDIELDLTPNTLAQAETDIVTALIKMNDKLTAQIELDDLLIEILYYKDNYKTKAERILHKIQNEDGMTYTEIVTFILQERSFNQMIKTGEIVKYNHKYNRGLYGCNLCGKRGLLYGWCIFCYDGKWRIEPSTEFCSPFYG